VSFLLVTIRIHSFEFLAFWASVFCFLNSLFLCANQTPQPAPRAEQSPPSPWTHQFPIPQKRFFFRFFKKKLNFHSGFRSLISTATIQRFAILAENNNRISLYLPINAVPKIYLQIDEHETRQALIPEGPPLPGLASLEALGEMEAQADLKLLSETSVICITLENPHLWNTFITCVDRPAILGVPVFFGRVMTFDSPSPSLSNAPLQSPEGVEDPLLVKAYQNAVWDLSVLLENRSLVIPTTFHHKILEIITTASQTRDVPVLSKLCSILESIPQKQKFTSFWSKDESILEEVKSFLNVFEDDGEYFDFGYDDDDQGKLPSLLTISFSNFPLSPPHGSPSNPVFIRLPSSVSSCCSHPI
jgi:hypothetical protein